MLVITRRRGESFYIDKNIKLTVVECYGGKVRIGVEAPREISVVREESIKERENREEVPSD